MIDSTAMISALLPALKPGRAHQSGDPVVPQRLVCIAQCARYPYTTISLTGLRIYLFNQALKPIGLLYLRRLASVFPLVITTTRDA